MENGILTPELLKKMERIQELLRDAIPDSSLQRMQREAENQQVGMEDVQRNLKDLLDRKDNIQQGLDRAIKMLEMLRDMHALENLSGDVDRNEVDTDIIGRARHPWLRTRGGDIHSHTNGGYPRKIGRAHV